MSLPIVYAYPYCLWEMPPARQRYLMEALSAHRRVVYLNPAHLEKSPRGIVLPQIEQISKNLSVVHHAFGLQSSRIGRRLGRFGATIDAWLLHRLLRQIDVTDYIYWLSAPNPELMIGMNTEHLVYDCIDPCFIPKSQDRFDQTEFGIAKQAKLIFCTAHSLTERMSRFNTNCHLLPNACSELDHFQEPNKVLSIPLALQACSRPIVGYMGTVDWRLDTEILTAAARALPEYTFALVGRINQDQETRLQNLRSLPNVVMTGVVSLEEGKLYTAAFDVGLIPFLPGTMNDAVNPVKMYMYLATGKPVVATWLREAVANQPLVSATQTTDEFICAIRRAVTDNAPSTIKRRIDFAHQNTWDKRASAATIILESQRLSD